MKHPTVQQASWQETSSYKIVTYWKSHQPISKCSGWRHFLHLFLTISYLGAAIYRYCVGVILTLWFKTIITIKFKQRVFFHTLAVTSPFLNVPIPFIDRRKWGPSFKNLNFKSKILQIICLFVSDAITFEPLLPLWWIFLYRCHNTVICCLVFGPKKGFFEKYFCCCF